MMGKRKHTAWGISLFSLASILPIQHLLLHFETFQHAFFPFLPSCRPLDSLRHKQKLGGQHFLCLPDRPSHTHTPYPSARATKQPLHLSPIPENRWKITGFTTATPLPTPNQKPKTKLSKKSPPN
jgi:hypothetical protein